VKWEDDVTELQSITIIAQAGVFFLTVDESGKYRLFTVGDDDRISVDAAYGEESPWSVRLPRARAVADALGRYYNDGDTGGLRELAGE
jgi:hypothetical protein